MFSIVSLFILTVVLVVFTIAIYKAVYTYKINKKILSGEVTGRKLVDVSKMVMITIIVGLAVYAALLVYVVNDYATRDYSVPRNNYAVIDVSDEEHYKYVSYFGDVQLEDASFAKVYQKEANEGYSKEIVESGEYVFTIFKRTTPADSFHPDFLCFADYVGEDNKEAICYSKAGFLAVSEEDGGFFGESAGDIFESLLYIGYLDKDSAFEIQMNLLDEKAENAYNAAMQKAYEEDKGDFPDAQEFAISTGSVTIVMEQ